MVDIQNMIGAAPQELASKVKEYFEGGQSPVQTALADLNELIGFPYGLVIDWRQYNFLSFEQI
jgi:hypothetical protein